jgi:hypothetical protein
MDHTLHYSLLWVLAFLRRYGRPQTFFRIRHGMNACGHRHEPIPSPPQKEPPIPTGQVVGYAPESNWTRQWRRSVSDPPVMEARSTFAKPVCNNHTELTGSMTVHSSTAETICWPEISWPQVHKPRATKSCPVAPNICGPSVWNPLRMTLLEPRNLRELLDFWKTSESPDISNWNLQYTNTGNVAHLYWGGAHFESRSQHTSSHHWITWFPPSVPP